MNSGKFEKPSYSGSKQPELKITFGTILLTYAVSKGHAAPVTVVDKAKALFRSLPAS